MVGDWRVEPDLDRISRMATETHLRPQVMALLVYLAERPGQVVSNDEVLETLWRGKVVTSGSIYNCIAELRLALAAGDDETSYIETIPKHGYRLLAPVSGSIQGNFDLDKESGANSRTGRMATALIVAASVGALIIGYYAVNQYGPDSTQTIARSTGADRSIAVLPFRSLSGFEDNIDIADSIHGNIVTRIANDSSMARVISTTFVEGYRGANSSSMRIGEELRVATLLEGDVLWVADRIQIHVRLIDATTGDVLWAKTYIHQMNAENLIAVQSDISNQVVTTLQDVFAEYEDIGEQN